MLPKGIKDLYVLPFAESSWLAIHNECNFLLESCS